MKNLILSSVFCLLGGAALAHHSTAVDDMTRTETVTGTVRVFQWTNPHVWLWVNAPAQGATPATVWGIESAAPVQLSRRGIKWNSFVPGDQVAVTIHPLRSGKNGGLFVQAKFADGHVISAGDPAAAALPPNPAGGPPSGPPPK